MNKYSWAIEDIFATQEEWDREFSKVEKFNSFAEFKNKLSDANTFLSCMKKMEKLSRKIDKLSVYAYMMHDSDTQNAFYDSILSKITALSVKISEDTAFIVPELTTLPEEKLQSMIENPLLSDYDYTLKCILKEKKHVLSENEEKLLALSTDTLLSFKEIFTKIDNADLNLPYISHKGEKIPLSHGTYGMIMTSPDRALRKKCFKAYYKSYLNLINTISATYYGNVKKDVFLAKAKKYGSALEKALSAEDVPEVVYKNLIESVHTALPLLHDYMKEKKKGLNLRQMHMYDIYASTIPDAELKLEYDDAYKLVIEGLKPLGQEYLDLLKRAYDERWLDVYESKGKKSGAYSIAVYDTHPFVLLNYQKTTHNVFTIAHEMGHSIHSYYSNKNQCYAKADYKIFVAEVASTVNEVLLIKYLLKTATDKKVLKYLSSYLLEMVRTTLFRQTQFAEFEQIAHSLVENGQPLTKQNLSDEYLELNKKYYGPSVISDEEIKYEWARIPHFYRAFYVYKYATGIISAMAIVDRIEKEGKKAVDDYFEFLSSGSKDGPVELLKIAGVDLTDVKPYKSAFETFEKVLNQFKSL